MKIYEIQWHTGEKSWVCANSAIEAVKVYCKSRDMNFDEFDVMDDVVVLPKLKWPFHRINNAQSFSQYMSSAVKPDVITETFKNYIVKYPSVKLKILSLNFSKL